MYGIAHATFGLALCYVAGFPVVTGIIAAIMPDIDALFHFSFPFVHRGILHTPVAAVVVAGVVFAVSDRRMSAYAAFVGWCSHLALDTFTPSGIMWLYPLRAEYSFVVAEAASLSVNIAFAAVSIAVAWTWSKRWRWMRWMRRL